MDKFVIEGGKRLKGEVEASGAKNSALPILAATLLAEGESIIENVPNLRDIGTMVKLLRSLGARVNQSQNSISVKPGNSLIPLAPYKIVSEMRASVCVLGPLLGRLGEAEVSFPGGCVIGPRPIDLHLKGLAALGAKITIEHGYVKARGNGLRGAEVYLGGPSGSSVLGTDNVMMAAALAKGETVIESGACEPEVVDLANFLVAMGAKIEGQGSHRIWIRGVKKLRGARYRIIPDRIEAGTYLIAGAMTGGNVSVRTTLPEHHNALMDKLTQAGCQISKGKNFIRVRARSVLRPVDVTTLPYPGFPTDLQAQMMALMVITPGISIITEKIYPDRFMHVSELNRMGSRVFLEGASAIVTGVARLSGAHVMASDLRASAALVLAGLVADGRTDIHRVYHLDRGYEKVDKKLAALGASVWREKE
jgi:UDP-N-acetylglucosamine 1-carboxyvinyltransferase